MKRKTLIKNLRWNLAWLRKQTAKTANDKAADRAEAILVGTLDIVDYIPVQWFDVQAWLDRPIYGRKAPRADLARVRTTFYRSKALTGLLETVAEALEGLTWIDDLPAGSLPVKVRVPETAGIGKQEIRAL